jgi:hypothetical protein
MQPLHIGLEGAVALLDLAYSLGMQGGSGSAGGERLPPYRIQTRRRLKSERRIRSKSALNIGANSSQSLPAQGLSGGGTIEGEHQIKG